MSSHPKLVLDTNVLRDREFIHWTQSQYHGKVCTSVVSYMELKRQMLHNGREDNLDLILRKANIDVLQYTPRMATFAAQTMDKKGDGRCKTCGKIDWADIMIYSSIDNPPTILVTKNIKDFPYERVKTPEEIMEMFSGRFSLSIEI